MRDSNPRTPASQATKNKTRWPTLVVDLVAVVVIHCAHFRRGSGELHLLVGGRPAAERADPLPRPLSVRLPARAAAHGRPGADPARLRRPPTTQHIAHHRPQGPRHHLTSRPPTSWGATGARLHHCHSIRPETVPGKAIAAVMTMDLKLVRF